MLIERKKDYLTVAIALIGGVKFRVLGTFYASEILIFILLLFANWDYIKANKYAWTLFKLAILWFISAIFTDLWVENELINSLKGQFNVVFFFVQFPVVYWLLYDKPKRYLYFLVATGVVSIPNMYLFGPEIDESSFGLMGENIWLYYAMVPLAIGIISWLYYENKINAIWSSLLMVIFGLFMLFHNSRNIFLTMLLSATLLLIIIRDTTSNFEYNVSVFKNSIIKIFVFLFIGMVSVNSLYEYLASNGTLGEYAYLKYQKQKQAANILEGGRGETFMGIELIKRSPIIGYGSFAIDKGDEFHREYAQNHNAKYIPLQYERRLPAHSHIVGAWMENGIGGGIFWFFTLLLMWKVFKSGAFLIYPKFLPAFLLMFTKKLWDIIFSPFGLRVPETFFLMFICIIYFNYINKINSTDIYEYE